LVIVTSQNFTRFEHSNRFHLGRLRDSLLEEKSYRNLAWEVWPR